MTKPTFTDQEQWENLLRRVTADPLRCGGAPCVDNRVPVSTILGGLGLRMTPREIIQYFPSLVFDDIMAACAYASEFIDELAQLRAALSRVSALADEWDTRASNTPITKTITALALLEHASELRRAAALEQQQGQTGNAI